MDDGQPGPLNQVRDQIRRKHYNIKAEQAYVDWIRRFVLLHTIDTPGTWGGGGGGIPDASRGGEAGVGFDAEQAKSAVLFLYKEVLGESLPWARRHRVGQAA